MAEVSTWQRWWLNSWFHRLKLKRNIPAFLRVCPDPFRGEVLELGAGHGWTSHQLLKTFPQVALTATDTNIQTVRAFTHLQQQYGRRLKVRSANILNLPFDRASFDIVVIFNVLGYLNSYGRKKAIEESLRVLRQGGLLGLREFPTLFKPDHPNQKKIVSLLKQEGCEIAYEDSQHPLTIWARKPFPIEPEVSNEGR